VSEFAKRLRAAREAAGATSYRLAQLTGLSKQAVLNLEKAGADPKLSTVLKLAEALGRQPWELLPGGRPPATAPKPGAVGQEVAELLDELDEIGRMHQAMMSPVIVRLIAAKLRRALGSPEYKRPKKAK
jgi:transcriptional regulator with XRE-family HTH domain